MEAFSIRHEIPHDFTSWDCLIIGKGKKGTSATKSRNDLEHISDNSISFWISGTETFCGMTIFKDTKEGKKLESMVNINTTPPEKIYDYLTTLTFKKLTPKNLLRWIKCMNEIWYCKGKAAKIDEIKQVLNIYN